MSVGFFIQDEAMDEVQSAPLGVLLLLFRRELDLCFDEHLFFDPLGSRFTKTETSFNVKKA